MPTFRILNQDPVYFDLRGNVAAGGYLRFYDSETTTPRSVYGDPSLSVNNGSTVEIGSDGRAVNDIWGDGDYRVRVYAADDTLISEADFVQIPGGSGSGLPALVAGNFLSNDGSVAQWVDLLQLPDPTGSAGKILGTDGTSFLFQSPPLAPDVVLPAGGITQGEGYFTIGSLLIQFGTSSASSATSKTATKNISFPTAYASTPKVFIQPNGSGPTPNGVYVRCHALTISASAFTAGFSTQTGGTSADNYSGSNITSDVQFSWAAIGSKA